MDLIIKHKNNLLDACIYPFMDYCTLYTFKDLFEFINSFWLLIVLAQVIIQERVFDIHCQISYSYKYDNYHLCIFNVLRKEYSIIVNCLNMINNLVIRHTLKYVYNFVHMIFTQRFKPLGLHYLWINSSSFSNY